MNLKKSIDLAQRIKEKAFEEGFDAINASKVNLGKYRRQLSCEFIKNFSELSCMDDDDLVEYFIEFTS